MQTYNTNQFDFINGTFTAEASELRMFANVVSFGLKSETTGRVVRFDGCRQSFSPDGDVEFTEYLPVDQELREMGVMAVIFND